MKKIVSIILSWCLVATVTISSATATDTDEEIQYVPDEVIAAVSSVEEAEMVASYYDIDLQSYAHGVAIFTVPSADDLVRQSQTYSLMPELHQNRIYTLFETEASSYSTQAVTWEYAQEQYHHDDINTSSAWESATGEGVVVAIIDTGVDIDHEALTHAISDDMAYNSNNQEYGLNAVDDDHGHGTHVAGIVAAYSEDAGVYGVAPDADLMIIKANMDDSDSFTVASLVRAINYAVDQGADIINMSLGASYAAGAYTFEQDAIDDAVDAGVTVICAAGNFKESHAGYPAAYDSAIAVSAVGEGYEFASWYSNYGPEIDVAAPGSYIYSTYYNGGYGYKSGTSMACPVVSGVAALIMSANPSEDYTPEEIRTMLSETAMDTGELGRDDYYGSGVINAYSAVLGVDALYEVNYYDGDTLLATTYVAPDAYLVEPDDPTGDYDFLGWTTSCYGTEVWDFSTPVTENLILYANLDFPEGCYSATNDDSTTVLVVFTPTNTVESGQIILGIYENGQLGAVSIETYDSAQAIRITATCQGGVDEVIVFDLDGDGTWIPLTETTNYSLT